MGRYTFRLPDIGEGIAEAEIVAWHVNIGDMVEEDGRLADMMTDKATVEMESPKAGKVLEMAGEVGDMVAIGAPLVVLEVEKGGEEESGAPAPTSSEVRERIEEENSSAEEADKVLDSAKLVSEKREEGAATAASDRPDSSSGIKARADPEGERGNGAPPSVQMEEIRGRAASSAKVMASPAVRMRAKDLGIDLLEVRPAADGRVRHADLDAFLAYSAAGGFQPAGRTGKNEQVRVIGLRRRIAEQMTASKRNIPHFTYVEEYDVTALEETRAQLNDHRGERPKLTVLPFLITAICRLLPDFPMLNGHFDDEAGVVTRYGAVHMGLATQTASGLMVPVIRDAQSRNLWQLAREIARLAEAARNGSVNSEELSGSTLTITSLGRFGGVASTPVINRPETTIIGPNRIVERPMFVRDNTGSERVEKRKLMNISFSCDHRVVDGWDAARFAQELKRLIETPALLLAR